MLQLFPHLPCMLLLETEACRAFSPCCSSGDQFHQCYSHPWKGVMTPFCATAPWLRTSGLQGTSKKIDASAGADCTFFSQNNLFQWIGFTAKQSLFVGKICFPWKCLKCHWKTKDQKHPCFSATSQNLVGWKLQHFHVLKEVIWIHGE